MFTIVLAIAFVIGLATQLLQAFDLPSWFLQLGPAIIYCLGLLFGTIDKARLGAGKEPMSSSTKKWLIFGASVGLAGALVATGGVTLPGGVPADLTDPTAVAAYLGILVTWFWGGSQAIFLVITAGMAFAGKSKSGGPPAVEVAAATGLPKA